MKVAIRTMRSSDYGFIVHSGKREILNLLSDADSAKAAPVMTPALDAIVRGASGAVACDASDPDALVGWALANQGVLLFVYVSAAVRGHGIAKRLAAYVAPKEEEAA